MLLELSCIEVLPGQHVLLQNVTWEEFEWISDELASIINILKNNQYQRSERSLIFPNLPLTQVIPQYWAESRTVGRNRTLRAFRQWVKNSMNSEE